MSGTVPPRLKTKAAELESELSALYKRDESNNARVTELETHIQKLGKEYRRLSFVAERMQAALALRHPLHTRPWGAGRIPTTGTTTYKGYHGVQAIENAQLEQEYNEMSYKLWDVRRQLDFIKHNADTLKAELSSTRLQRMCTSASITVTEGKLKRIQQETEAIAKRIAASCHSKDQGQAVIPAHAAGLSGREAIDAGRGYAACAEVTKRTPSTASGTDLSRRGRATLPASAARIDMAESDDEDMGSGSSNEASGAGSGSITTSTSSGSAARTARTARIDMAESDDEDGSGNSTQNALGAGSRGITTSTSSGSVPPTMGATRMNGGANNGEGTNSGAATASSVGGRSISINRNKRATKPVSKAASGIGASAASRKNTARSFPKAATNAATNEPRTKTSVSAMSNASIAEEPSSTQYEVGQLIWSAGARPCRRS